MDRSYCNMCHSSGNNIYCDYYDCFFQKCIDIPYGQCPEGLDNDKENYYSDNEYEEENW